MLFEYLVALTRLDRCTDLARLFGSDSFDELSNDVNDSSILGELQSIGLQVHQDLLDPLLVTLHDMTLILQWNIPEVLVPRILRFQLFTRWKTVEASLHLDIL